MQVPMFQVKQLFAASAALLITSSTTFLSANAAPSAVQTERQGVLDLIAKYSEDRRLSAEAPATAAKFEIRVTDQNQVISTYRELREMLAAETKLTSNLERAQLATEVLKQAACPININQGNHNTCAFAAIEARIYTLYPHAAAQLLRQVASTGRYLTSNSESIKLDASNLRADNEATMPGYGNRSYASQLFQITAANIYWQRQQEDPRGIKCGVGRIYYTQKPASLLLHSDTGERLQIRWEDGVIETVVDDSGRPMCQPCVSLTEVQEVGTIVASSPQSTFVIAGRKFDRSQKYIPVKSMEDLRRKLTDSQTDRSMPLVAAVDSKRGWFAEDPTARKMAGGWYTLEDSRVKTKRPLADAVPNGGWHAVCITGYDAINDTVSIDNFWGPHADHLGDKAISLSDLYSAIASN